MDNVVTPTAEELAAEQVAIQVPKEDDIRNEIITEYGFDADADKDRIDKLTQKEMKSRKDLSTAIGQKIKHRTDANEFAKKIPKPKEGEDARNGGGQAPVPKEDTLSYKDSFALTSAGVHVDDVDEVIKASKLLSKSIPDTLKDPIVMARLADLTEKRKTANAMNVDTTRPGNKNLSDSEIVDKAAKGDIPKAGSQEAEDLFFARRGGRRK